MNISTLSPIAQLPKSQELSSLRSPRDSNSLYHQWKKLSEIVEQQNKISNLVNQISREIKRIEDRKSLDFGFYPFQIYTLPEELRPTVDTLQYTASANWRTVRVRGGLVLTDVVSTQSYVQGTDGIQNYSYYNYLPNSVGTYDIQVPENTDQYWFWIEVSGSIDSITSGVSPYYLRYADDPTISDTGNPNPWDSFPKTDNNASGSVHIPIGYVDTITSGSENQAYVRQFLNSDVITTGGGGGTGGGFNWQGEFDISASYNYQDVIQRTIGTNSSMGNWFNVSLSGSIGIYPIWPYPSISGGTDVWKLMTAPTQQQTVCNGSLNLEYISAFNP